MTANANNKQSNKFLDFIIKNLVEFGLIAIDQVVPSN